MAKAKTTKKTKTTKSIKAPKKEASKPFNPKQFVTDYKGSEACLNYGKGQASTWGTKTVVSSIVAPLQRNTRNIAPLKSVSSAISVSGTVKSTVIAHVKALEKQCGEVSPGGLTLRDIFGPLQGAGYVVALLPEDHAYIATVLATCSTLALSDKQASVKQLKNAAKRALDYGAAVAHCEEAGQGVKPTDRTSLAYGIWVIRS